MIASCSLMLKGATVRLRRIKHVVADRVRFLDRQVTSVDSKRLARAVGKAKLFSLDVFDTALFRYVPEAADVFEIVGFRLAGVDGFPSDSKVFSKARRRAEEDVRRKIWAEARFEEVTIEEIYACLATSVSGIDAARGTQEELAVERTLCFANRDVKSLYDREQRGKTPITFLSDTYFPESFVSELLWEAGYREKHSLLTSSSERYTKHHGTLYGRAAGRAGTNKRDMVHLGDNRRADVEMAKRAGVRGFWYKLRVSQRPRLSENATIGVKVAARIQAHGRRLAQATNDDRVFNTLGYDLAGPVFLGVTQWLIARLKAKPVDLVLFCARDGVFVHQTYELFRRFDGRLAPSRYLQVSRRALVFPAIEELNEAALDYLCANDAAISTDEYFCRIGISIAEYPEALTAVGLNASSVIHSREERTAIRRLFVRLEDVVLARAREEKPLLLRYLREIGCFDAGRVALFDIGWGGTMQRALMSVMRSESHKLVFDGYYLSTDTRIHRLSPEDGSVSSWLTHAGEPRARQQFIELGYWILEIFFSAQHGTVLGYQSVGDGEVTAKLHEFDSKAPNAKAARVMQAAADDFVRRWSEIFNGVGPQVEMQVAFDQFRRFVEKPTNDEARVFGDLVHVGGLGSTHEDVPIAKPTSIFETLRSPKELWRRYRVSMWQVGYVQRIVKVNALARGLLFARKALRREAS